MNTLIYKFVLEYYCYLVTVSQTSIIYTSVQHEYTCFCKTLMNIHTKFVEIIITDVTPNNNANLKFP